MKPAGLGVLFFALIVAFHCTSAFAEMPRSAQVIHPQPVSLDQEPHLDGVLDEPVWELSVPARDFKQREPLEGQPASEKTEVRILYSPRALFLGVTCFDSQPDRILATELRRDDELENDDTFGVILDTFHDHRSAYLFRTNALGALYDGLVTDERRNINSHWDETWAVEARVTAEGWVAEIEIPFASLRSSYSRSQIWGINFERNIRRKNERTYWAGYGRDYEFTHISQAGELNDLVEVRTGLRLRVKPYAVGGFSKHRPDEEIPLTEWENESQVGLEDVKISLSPSVTADFTVNPDFAQADIDESRVNLTRFSLFFPEKREFFLEGAGTFEFGSGAPRMGFGGSPDVALFYSRRIGLDEETEIPINVGAKVTGDLSGFQFGFLDSQTRSTEEYSPTNYAVFRVKKKLLSRSYIGGIFTSKNVSEGGGNNRVGGIDGNFVLFDKLTLTGYFATSDSGRNETENLSYQASARWNSDLLDAEYDRISVERDFDPQVGFVRRENVVKQRARIAWFPRPDMDLIRQLWISATNEWYTSHDNYLESRDNEIFFGARFESGDFLGVGFSQNYEHLNEDFEVFPDVTIPVGSYHFDQMRVFARAYAGRRIAGGARITLGEFYDGKISSWSLGPEIKFNHHFSTQVDYGLNQISLPHGDFTAHVINSRFNYNLTNRLLTSAAIQYNNVDQDLNLNIRFNYIYRPGDDLFIVYNEGHNYDPLSRGLLNRTLLVKFTHSFDF